MSQFSSRTDLKKEFVRCASNPIYFINHYVKIPDPSTGASILLKTYDFQNDLVMNFHEFRRNIVAKARQMGISTIAAAYICWLMLFKNEQQIAVIAIKFDTAKNLLKKVKYAFKHLPEFFQALNHNEPLIKFSNRTTLTLFNGSEIKAHPSSEDAVRSEALSLLVIDEAAHIESIDDIWGAAKPTLSKTGGKVFAISCVVGDTFVFTDKGVKQVKDFIKQEDNGGYHVDEYSILGKDKVRSGNLFLNNGETETKKLITKYGDVEGSFEHKLWAFKDNKFGWFKMGELSDGDFISIQYGKDLWGTNDNVEFIPKITSNHKNIFECRKINKDLAYIFGLFLAEGSNFINKNKDGKEIGCSITLTCGDDLNEHLKKLCLKYWTDEKLRYTISSKTFGDFLRQVGFDFSLKAPKKFIPSRLLEMSRENIVSLLQGIFDGDGFSTQDKGCVGIGLSSKKMIEQIRVLLLNLGILTTYYEYLTQPTKKVKVCSKRYILEMGQGNSKKFFDIVGFRFDRKQNKQKVLSRVNFAKANGNDVIPNSLSIMKEMFDLVGLGTWSLSKYHNLNISNVVNKKNEYQTKNISRQNILKMLSLAKNKLNIEYKKELEKIISEDLVWVPIKKVISSKNKVYDFSLPNNEQDFWAHSVIYNGFLGHQSPNGAANWFHDIWEGSQSMEGNGWKGTHLPWQRHPERDMEWFLEETKDFSPRYIAQEYEVSFLASGETVISGERLLELKKASIRPLHRIGVEQNLWIWKKPEKNRQYVIPVDVARGDGEDFSAFHVLDVSTMEQVAEFVAKIDTDDYARIIQDVGMEYNEALIIPENAMVGHELAKKLWKAGYKNVYWSRKGTHEYVPQHQAIATLDKCVIGFTTSPTTRPWIISKMEEFVRLGVVKINSIRLATELQFFIWHNGKAEAQRGKNDDLVMALAIGCWIRDTVIVEKVNTAAFKKTLLLNISKQTSTLNTKIPGQIGYKSPNKMKKLQDEFLKRKKKSYLGVIMG